MQGSPVVDIVLHIGAPKCGSSAIQTALTKNPVLEKDDGTSLTYGIIDGRGSLVYGTQLGRRKTPRGYLASGIARRIEAFDEKQLTALGRQLDEVDAGTLVLSSEGWLPQSLLFQRLLSNWRKTVRVIAYVRPQANYLNAAWWQWGAWQDVGFDTWLAQRLPASLWSNPLGAWRDNPYVTELSIRLLPDDVVDDFLAVLGVKRHPSASNRTNTGLPTSILRLYQRNRRLRPSKNASYIDFALARRVFYAGSAPWVLSRNAVEDIISKARPSNEGLLQMLSPDAAAAMLGDLRWWETDAFADEKVEPWEPQPPNVDELESLCVAMAEAIVRMERQSLGRK